MLSKVLQSKYFKISMLIFVLLAICFYAVYSLTAAHESLRAEQENIDASLTNFAGYFGNLAMELENSVYLISKYPEIVNFYHGSDKPDLMNLFYLRNRLQPFLTNQNIQEVILFFMESNYIYVYDQTLFRADKFYDNRFLESANILQSTPIWIEPRVFDHRNGNASSRKITYLRKFYITKHPYVIGIYVPADRIINSAGLFAANSKQTLILTSGDDILYATNNDLLPAIKENLPAIFTESLFSNNKKFYDVKIIDNKIENLTAISLTEKQSLPEYWLRAARDSFFILFLLLMIGFLASTIYSYSILAFVNKVMKKFNQGEPEAKKSFFSITATEELLYKADELSTLFERYDALLRQKYLSSLLLGYGDIADGIQYEIHFDKPFFNVITVVIKEFDRIAISCKRDQILVYINECISTFMSEGGIIQTILVDEGQWLCVLNMDNNLVLHGKEQLIKIIDKLRKHIDMTFKMQLLFSVGTTVLSSDDLFRSYLGSKHNIDFLSSYGNEYIIFSDDTETPIPKERPWESKIYTAILNRDAENIKKIIEEIQLHISSFENLTTLRQIIAMLIFTTYIAFWERGIETKFHALTYMSHHLSEFSGEIEAFLNEIIQKLTDDLETTNNSNNNQHVANAISFIANNYQKDISVVNISNYVGVSSIYLNRIFKIHTGKTIGEYLNSHRISIAKAMLSDHSLSISEISHRVGYNDMRSFTNNFKKIEGIAPSDYRKSI